MRKLIIILVALAAFFTLSQTASAIWWDANYQKCKPVTLNLSSGNLSNFTARINVTYDSDMQADFDDIRFVSGTNCTMGTALLGQYLVNKTNSQFANYEVMLPTINTTVLMYYGNSTISPYSNRRDANLFYDNFSEAAINSTLWYENSSGGSTALHDSLLSISITTDDALEIYCTNSLFSTPLAVEFDFIPQVTADPVRGMEIAYFFHTSTTTWYQNVVSIYENSGWTSGVYNQDITVQDTYVNNTAYHAMITGTSSLVSIYTNVTGTLSEKSTATIDQDVPSAICPHVSDPGGWQNNHMHFDNFMAYRYSTGALSYSFGYEEDYGGIDITPPTVTLVSPANSNITNSSTAATITFNCSAIDNINLANFTLWGNWLSWHANQTIDKSGLWNYSTFSKTLNVGNYIWNCRACDNSSNCAFAASNYSFTIKALVNPVINITSPLNASYDIWNATAKNFDNLAIVLAITNSSQISTLVWSFDGGSNNTFTNGSAFFAGAMKHNITICANNTDNLWGCDTEYFELNGGTGDPKISFNYTISGVCSSAYSAYSNDFDGDGVNEIALGAFCDNASLWIMDNCSIAGCLQPWSAPRWVADTDFSGAADYDRFVWWIKMIDMGGSEGVKNEVCLGTGGIANSWTRCYLYNQTSKWYDENYTFVTGDADHFNGQPCDVNGDGKAELIMTQYTTAGWYVIHNYTETAPTFYSFGGGFGSNGIHCEDINGDGKVDSVTSNGGGVFKYLYWNGSAYLSVGLPGSIWDTHTVFRNDESYYCDWDSDGVKELLIQNPYSALNAYNITNFNATSLLNLSQVLPQSTFTTRGGGIIIGGQSSCQIAANYPSSGDGLTGALYYNISTLDTFFIGYPVAGNNNWAMDSNFLDIDRDNYSEVLMHQRSIDGTTADTKIIMGLDFSQMGGFEMNINWNTPANNSFTLNLSSILWNATISETPDTCILNINGTANYSMFISGNDCYYTASNLTNQTTYCGIIYANNSASNVSSMRCAAINLTSEAVVPPAPITGYMTSATRGFLLLIPLLIAVIIILLMLRRLDEGTLYLESLLAMSVSVIVMIALTVVLSMMI